MGPRTPAHGRLQSFARERDGTFVVGQVVVRGKRCQEFEARIRWLADGEPRWVKHRAVTPAAAMDGLWEQLEARC